MLPDIVTEDREEALRDWVVLIGGRDDLNFAALFAGEPDPSGAELLDASFIEFGLEISEVAESLGDYLGDGAVGIASAFGLHDLPEHGVIDVAAAVIADCGANVLGMFFDCCVEVLDVGTVVHVVVQGHRLLIDDGFEGRVVVG